MTHVPFSVTMPMTLGSPPCRGAPPRSADASHRVDLAGELERRGRSVAFESCTSAELVHLVADLSRVSFMDCAGYGGLVEARGVLERRGGSLSLMNPVGEPLRLLTLLGAPSFAIPTARQRCAAGLGVFAGQEECASVAGCLFAR